MFDGAFGFFGIADGGGAVEGVDLEDEAVGGRDEVGEGRLAEPRWQHSDDEGSVAGDATECGEPLPVAGKFGFGAVEVDLEFGGFMVADEFCGDGGDEAGGGVVVASICADAEGDAGAAGKFYRDADDGGRVLAE